MDRNKKNIGAVNPGFQKSFNDAFDQELVLWFWFCLYTEEQIANSFEFSTTILKKRAAEMKFLDIMASDSGYTSAYFISRIKTTLPKLYPSLKTLSDFKINVESGKFTGISKDSLMNKIGSFLVQYFQYGPTLTLLTVNLAAGCPDFTSDFVKVIVDSSAIKDSTDPFNPVDVVTAATTAATTTATTTATTSSLASIGLPLAIGGAILYTLFSKKK